MQQLSDFEYLYNAIILFLFFMGILFVLHKEVTGKVNNKIGVAFVFLFAVALFFLFGFRGEDIGTDTAMYIWQYENEWKFTNYDNREPLYPYFIKLLRLLSPNPQFFIASMAFLFLMFISRFIKNFKISNDDRNVGKYLLFVSLVSLPSFSSLGINIIRQGVSIAILYNAYNAFVFNKKKETYLLMFFSVFFHTTSIIPIFLFFVSKYFKTIKYPLVIYTLGALLSAFNFGLVNIISLVSFLSKYDPRFDAYIMENREVWDYNVGFRANFVIFNTVFLLIAIYIFKKVYNKKEYIRLISYFCLSSFVFFMAFQIPYSDRWGLFSWISIPLLLSPLLLQKGRVGNFSFVYAFSFMIFIFFNLYGKS